LIKKESNITTVSVERNQIANKLPMMDIGAMDDTTHLSVGDYVINLDFI